MQNENNQNENNKVEQKKYWRSLEDLNNENQLDLGQDKLQNINGLTTNTEFLSSPIREGSEKEAATDESRRDFMKLMAASFAMFGASACARRPVEHVVSYVKKPEHTTAGIAEWYASTIVDGSEECGVLIKTREHRPIKLEGNPEHPYSKGGLTATAQALVLSLYDPDRLQESLETQRKGLNQKSGNDKIHANIVEKLKSIKAKNGKVVVLTSPIFSPTTNKLIDSFVSAFGSGSSHVSYSPLSLEEQAVANEASYGARTLNAYDFEKANYILSFGADYLGTWGDVVSASKGWSKKRKLGASNSGNKEMSKTVAFESMMTLTGSNADERYRISSGDELKLALAIACELIVNQSKSKFSSDSALKAILQKYSPEKIAKDVQVDLSKIKEIAHDLWENRGQSLVLGGGNIVKGSNAAAIEAVVNLLNSAIENEGKTVFSTGVKYAASTKALLNLVEDLNAGKVSAVIIYGANPAYTLPQSIGFIEALKKAELVVNVNTHLDETAVLSDYVVAASHEFEKWSDVQTKANVISISQPTIYPLYSTISFEEALLKWGKDLGFSNFNETSYLEYLKNSWKHYQAQIGDARPFVSFWNETLRKGFAYKKSNPQTRSFNKNALSLIDKIPAQTTGLKLVMYKKVAGSDGALANNSWLYELPDPVTKVVWDNYACVSPKFAKEHGLKDGDMVKLTANNFSLEIPVLVQPGTHDDTVAVAVGFGRTNCGSVGNKIGFNIYPLSSRYGDFINTTSISVKLEKTGKKYKLAKTQFQDSIIDDRPIIKEASYSEYKQKPNAGNVYKDKLTTLWPTHDYPGYKWAMSIDLNACTGCSACVISCQAENNVPVVGKEHVLRSREMHWIRIDRYYSGRADNPETVYQPMLCQHCENAPCENVCPVLATVHDHEGLNQQIYNRCVGTRYCANNCPYKVRRFNWFTFTDVAKPLNLAYNPDVTVRTRGVMEKCTFCVQRIREAKDLAKDTNSAVPDGAIKTACQQSCPTDAITFGNINNKDSSVSQWTKDPRGYRVLEELNVRPSITYLTKIRNRNSKEHSLKHS
jgi:molybdopterin-containing oxidoreductase family iron-sulfur binding subunit